MARMPQPEIDSDRTLSSTTEWRRQVPPWAAKLAHVTSEKELLEAVADLCNFRHDVPFWDDATDPEASLAARMAAFIHENLHKGLTLKVLAQFLGYSEKYCSELFRDIMGESFSSHVKRQRLIHATRLLSSTDKGMAEIARAIGFSDQFAFSHFFKRATGLSPIQIRTHDNAGSRQRMRNRRTVTP